VQTSTKAATFKTVKECMVSAVDKACKGSHTVCQLSTAYKACLQKLMEIHLLLNPAISADKLTHQNKNITSLMSGSEVLTHIATSNYYWQEQLESLIVGLPVCWHVLCRLSPVMHGGISIKKLFMPIPFIVKFLVTLLSQYKMVFWHFVDKRTKSV